MHIPKNTESGFTLIEIAVVMIMIGLLVGGYLQLFGELTKQKIITKNQEYLELVKTSLLAYAQSKGALPWADIKNEHPDDGKSNNNVKKGWLPWETLQIPPKDIHQRQLRYHIYENMGDKNTICPTLENDPFTGEPKILLDNNQISVAALITSKGSDAFDDMVAYITRWELYQAVCSKQIKVTVKNEQSFPIYIWDNINHFDIIKIDAGYTEIISQKKGTEIKLCKTQGGCSPPVHSTPPTPYSIQNNILITVRP